MPADDALSNALLNEQFLTIYKFLVAQNFKKAQEKINSNPEILKYRHKDKLLLEHIVNTFNAVTIKWVCDAMQNHHISIDCKDKFRMSALQDAYIRGYDLVVKVMLPYSNEPRLTEWLALRQLACVLGESSLKACRLTFINPNIFTTCEAGYSNETLHLMSSAISVFAEGKNPLAPIVKSIRYWERLAHSKLKADVNDVIARIDRGQRIYFTAGYTGHGFCYSIKKNVADGSYLLSFYDLNFHPTGGLKYEFIRSTTVLTSNSLQKIIQELKQNINSDKKITMGLIESIPSRYNTSPYVLVKYITTKDGIYLDKNRCYWENIKIVDNIEIVYEGKANPRAIKELRCLVASRHEQMQGTAFNYKKAALIGATILIMAGAFAATFMLTGPLALGTCIVYCALMVGVGLYTSGLGSKVVDKLRRPIPIAFFAERRPDDSPREELPASSLWPSSAIVAN